MGLRFHDTLTKGKRDFIPLVDRKVGIYVCGITAYDTCHVGHARSAVVFDMITRYLKYRGFQVNYVKNFTDVDDKIIDRANREGTDIHEISERYIREHNDDMDRLGVARPSLTPRATENIQGMIRMIDRLIEKGLAYVVDGDVFFSVERFPGYGKLSGRNIDEMMAGARIDVDEKKQNPMDFVLWKGSKPGEPWWDSPWGRGRPGWHIECSVMSQRYLGETFDIHGGGEDLIFPHHENEIAQSEGAWDKPFARYWLHNGFIRVNKEKMSKSLGNIFNLRDAMNQFHPEVLRFFVLQSHYRSPIDFSDDSLRESRAGMERFYETLKRIKDLLPGGEGKERSPDDLTGADKDVYEKTQALSERFVEAMDDDFNTARALGSLFEFIRILNNYMTDKGFEPTERSLFVLSEARKRIRELGKVLGLFLVDPDEYFGADRDREAAKRGLDTAEIEGLIAERSLARREKNWKRADEIRD
ncbi:MAG TPA: cysteine--tRNA ligase, partial [Syntrophales bacterium]|nr:cysteine--tRNA ligase [Syntrophales bacterium]